MDSLNSIPSWVLLLVAVAALVVGNRDLVWGWLRAAWGWVRPAPPSPAPPNDADIITRLIGLREDLIAASEQDAAELVGQAITKVLEL